jgi:hypothetical protein
LAAPRHGQQRQSVSKVTACGGLAGFNRGGASPAPRRLRGIVADYDSDSLQRKGVSHREVSFRNVTKKVCDAPWRKSPFSATHLQRVVRAFASLPFAFFFRYFSLPDQTNFSRFRRTLSLMSTVGFAIFAKNIETLENYCKKNSSLFIIPFA